MMKNLKLYAVGILAGAFGASAHAQSSVTLYGIISVGIEYASNESGHSNVKMLSGTLQGSRWGLKINEDLGGGLAAVAQLENGFDVTKGTLSQGGREFGRQAFVGLSSKSFGTVTFGRHQDTFWDILVPFYGPAFGNSLQAHIGDNDNLFGSYRLNNTVKYVSPTIAGFLGEAMYSFSNSAGAFANNRAYGLGLSYSHGPISAGLAYMNVDNPGPAQPDGAVTNDYSGAPFLLFRTSPINSTVGVSKERRYGGGASYYVTDALGVSINVTQTRFKYLDSTSLRLTNYDATLNYRITPALFAAVGYVYSNGLYDAPRVGNPHWNMASLSLDYLLSKRTDIYIYGVLQHASSAKADIYGNAPSSNSMQSIVLAGIRTKF
jgi:predicted porin